MNAVVQKWGNSLALRIPKAVAEHFGLTEESAVELVITETELVVRPARPVYALDDLLAQITPENMHDEADFGTPQGAEVW